mmetsp:Transcript_15909/g.20196  ORF Transcript_15909/g.20196 Transcript_15909/m.20196 type:complete len:189 (-) Transcript_15909:198-764(-)
MRVITTILLLLAATCASVSASIALPGLEATSLANMKQRPFYGPIDDSIFQSAKSRRQQLFPTETRPLAMAIPGYGIAEQVFVGGFANFLQIYNYIITARILLSWFPQAQGVGALQPVFAITDPYLNLFRGIIPPIFGLDLSPILAFVTLNLLSSSTAAVGHELPQGWEEHAKQSRFGRLAGKGFAALS